MKKAIEVHVHKTTIIYGKISVPIFPNCRKFIVTDSYIKNPEFAYRPLTNECHELKLLGNDYYGVLGFNMVYHLCYYMNRFENLRRFEFEG